MTPITPLYNSIGASVSGINWSAQPKYQTPVQKADGLSMPWLKDKTIKMALEQLGEIEFAAEDVKYLSNMGVKVPFNSGKEAVNYIKKNNIRITFDKPSEEGIHAQYDFSKNMMILNKRYKGMENFPVILALSEAILHEACHARDNDGESSVQEELDSLGMNAVCHRAYLKKYGDLFAESKEPIVTDGVSIYSKLFFEPDPEKLNLISRMRTKYGYLPAGDAMHPPSRVAKNVKSV